MRVDDDHGVTSRDADGIDANVSGGVAPEEILSSSKRHPARAPRQPGCSRTRSGRRAGGFSSVADKPVTEAMDRLHEDRMAGIVSQHVANFGDEYGQTAIRNERVRP